MDRKNRGVTAKNGKCWMSNDEKERERWLFIKNSSMEKAMRQKEAMRQDQSELTLIAEV